MPKQSSPEMSTLASKYINIQPGDMPNPLDMEQLCADLRSLAASVLSQDETKGQKRG